MERPSHDVNPTGMWDPPNVLETPIKPSQEIYNVLVGIIVVVAVAASVAVAVAVAVTGAVAEAIRPLWFEMGVYD